MNKLLLTFAFLALAGSAFAVDAYTQNLLLNLHNVERNCIGLKQLTWSDSLAVTAQTWSDYLASSGNFEHSGDPVGENIAEASIRDNVVAFMFSLWSGEKADFTNANPFPDVNLNSNAVGHYTQLIWSATYEVGCGVSNSTDGMSYLVCQYLLGGNYIGNYVYTQADIVNTPNCNAPTTSGSTSGSTGSTSGSTGSTSGSTGSTSGSTSGSTGSTSGSTGSTSGSNSGSTGSTGSTSTGSTGSSGSNPHTNPQGIDTKPGYGGNNNNNGGKHHRGGHRGGN